MRECVMDETANIEPPPEKRYIIVMDRSRYPRIPTGSIVQSLCALGFLSRLYVTKY